MEGLQGLLDWREVLLHQGEGLLLEVSPAVKHVGGLILLMSRQGSLLDVNWAGGEAVKDDIQQFK